jgi:hypothetical protein
MAGRRAHPSARAQGMGYQLQRQLCGVLVRESRATSLAGARWGLSPGLYRRPSGGSTVPLIHSIVREHCCCVHAGLAAGFDAAVGADHDCRHQHVSLAGALSGGHDPGVPLHVRPQPHTHARAVLRGKWSRPAVEHGVGKIKQVEVYEICQGAGWIAAST